MSSHSTHPTITLPTLIDSLQRRFATLSIGRYAKAEY